MAGRRTSLLEETLAAAAGTWRLLLGRPDATAFFDFSRRGLAGSFIPLLLANMVLVAFIDMSPAVARSGVSQTGQLLIVCLFVALRLGALYLVLPRLGAGERFGPIVVASNWASAVSFTAILGGTFGFAFVAAMALGPAAGETIVGLILALWGAVLIAVLVIEFNIYRLVGGLRTEQIVLAAFAQLFALVLGATVLAQLQG